MSFFLMWTGVNVVLLTPTPPFVTRFGGRDSRDLPMPAYSARLCGHVLLLSLGTVLQPHFFGHELLD